MEYKVATKLICIRDISDSLIKAGDICHISKLVSGSFDILGRDGHGTLLVCINSSLDYIDYLFKDHDHMIETLKNYFDTEQDIRMKKLKKLNGEKIL